MCLHTLNDMQRLIATDHCRRTLMGKVSSAVHTMYAEGRMDEAIKLFNDRQDFFYFLLTPEVCRTRTSSGRDQPKRGVFGERYLLYSSVVSGMSLVILVE
ncbi:hypothetical protein V8E55_003663 [Tylopilus felleus]